MSIHAKQSFSKHKQKHSERDSFAPGLTGLLCIVRPLVTVVTGGYRTGFAGSNYETSLVNRKRPIPWHESFSMAGPTGFEPAIFSVTGRRDRPDSLRALGHMTAQS